MSVGSSMDDTCPKCNVRMEQLDLNEPFHRCPKCGITNNYYDMDDAIIKRMFLSLNGISNMVNDNRFNLEMLMKYCQAILITMTADTVEMRALNDDEIYELRQHYEIYNDKGELIEALDANKLEEVDLNDDPI